MRIAKIDRTQLSSGTFLFWKRVASILDLVSRVVDTILSSDLYLFVGPALRKRPCSRKVDKCGTVFC